MTSQEYEAITQKLFARITEQVEGEGAAKQVKRGLRNRVKGQSGYRHQIDVSVELTHDLLLVECKMWKAQVNVPAFLAFLARIIDIRPTQPALATIHASMVTTRGFQSGVRKLADYYNAQLDNVSIQLDKVSSPTEFGLRYKHLFVIGAQDDLNQWSDGIQIQKK